MRMRINIQMWLLSMALWLPAVPAVAESFSMQDREEINRLRAAQGQSAEEVNQLLDQVSRLAKEAFRSSRWRIR